MYLEIDFCRFQSKYRILYMSPYSRLKDLYERQVYTLSLSQLSLCLPSPCLTSLFLLSPCLPSLCLPPPLCVYPLLVSPPVAYTHLVHPLCFHPTLSLATPPLSHLFSLIHMCLIRPSNLSHPRLTSLNLRTLSHTHLLTSTRSAYITYTYQQNRVL